MNFIEAGTGVLAAMVSQAEWLVRQLAKWYLYIYLSAAGASQSSTSHSPPLGLYFKM